MSETLCALDDVEDGGSAGFNTLGKALLVVRRGDSVHVYENTCPHIGAPMDFVPGQFLNLDKSHIQCAMHGALFEIETGLCIHGPCIDKSLTPIEASIVDGKIVVS